MNKITRLLFTLGMILSGIAGSPTPCAANAPVTLKTETQTSRPAVRLSDLFNGVPAAIDRDIAQAPAPCKPAIYDTRVLDRLADTYRLDWQPQNGVDHVVVTAACTRISADMVRDAVIAKMKQDNVAKDRAFDVTFDYRTLEIDLPGEQKPDFDLANFSYDQTSKRFRTELTAQTDRGPYVLPLTGRVAIKRSVPILAHRMEAGATIGEADIDFVQVPEERISADVITETNQLIGRELRRDKAEDDIIHAHDVVPPRLVLRGSLVTMKIETPVMTVTTQGKAQQDGAMGEVIRVVNTQSNRIIEGTVTAPGVIEIHTAQKLASAE